MFVYDTSALGAMGLVENWHAAEKKNKISINF